MMERWSDGVLEYWSIGVLEYWSIGVLEQDLITSFSLLHHSIPNIDILHKKQTRSD